MCTEDIIQSEIDKFLEKKEISVPKRRMISLIIEVKIQRKASHLIYVSDFRLLKSMQ